MILTFKSSSLKYPYLSANIIGAWSGLINQSNPRIILFSELNEIDENKKIFKKNKIYKRITPSASII